MLHNWSNFVPYAVVTSHFRDPSTAECVLCKCINGLTTETGGESLGIEEFKMELELELNKKMSFGVRWDLLLRVMHMRG